MVVDGKLHASGNRPKQVMSKIESAHDFEQGRAAVAVTRISDGQARIQIPESDALYRGEADIMLVRFDEKYVTEVTRGENSGKTLTNLNVVRLLRPVACHRVSIRLVIDDDIACHGVGCTVPVGRIGCYGDGNSSLET